MCFIFWNDWAKIFAWYPHFLDVRVYATRVFLVDFYKIQLYQMIKFYLMCEFFWLRTIIVIMTKKNIIPFHVAMGITKTKDGEPTNFFFFKNSTKILIAIQGKIVSLRSFFFFFKSVSPDINQVTIIIVGK